ncbi:MAG: 5'-methylthioadenosine/S-adenosylhomocysteine nucleosidase [Paracoccaceae bacterium]|nr:5'-methylthioadenosine/S-adenosylhomocysteine nucleosidase [Paracoccaceae bacterium]MDE2916728.1 5'-methylthioadenosine/S-adenosylhomocysteine nucleosidase [Paracoccaceae bacterium]
MDNEFEPRIEKDREITKNTIQYLSNRFTAGMVMLIITTILVAPHAAQSEELMGERIAVVSAFAPELEILKSVIEDKSVHRINGIEFTTGILEGKDVVLFLSGISMVNAAMTVQLALDQFNIRSIVFSGIAGGVDPQFDIGDVIIAEQWAQYLEMVFARKVEEGWETIPFFEYSYGNFGMMFPRSVTVIREGLDAPETRFWFPADKTLLESAYQVAGSVVLERCTAGGLCLPETPSVSVGGSGVSGGAFIDNAEFRRYIHETFGAQVLDMESAAVAHVAWANDVPFLAVRSLADLAGGSGKANQMEVFIQLAAVNAAKVVKALLREM